MKEFDEKSKPAFNGAGLPHPFKIRGLGNDPEKGFRNECVWFSAYVWLEESLSFANAVQGRTL